ncbi:MAG TPA: hypothetical protein VFE31_13745 [Opitutaceae bacterium]|jgi:hypothetical protein|nr:hypothetical protein [Opitutaceae bacterium]
MERRQFLSLGALSLLGWRRLAAAAAIPRIVGAQIGPGIRVPGLHGDTWTTTWADDDQVYAVADDCFGLKAHPINSNLALFRLLGSPPALAVETVNPMTAFGKLTSLLADGASWKGSGLACIDGVLYLAVSRHHYMEAQSDWIQQSWDATIIKSEDHGRTWSAAPALDRAMFPGRIFANPYFVQYGRDGAAGPDASDRYVYAVSNDGDWNNGNWMTLGRVRRDRIGRLDPADWEFVHGLDAGHRPKWGPRHDNALATFRAPGRTSMTGVQYLAGLGVYVMPQWHYPDLGDPVPEKRWQTTRFELYRAPAPWGPWTLFHSQTFSPQGYYNPGIPAKFIREDGRRFWLIASGDFYPSPAGNPYYTINQFPVQLELA